jgi:hypothetical protein
MKSNLLPKPIRTLDELVLKQFTRLGKRLNLNEDRRKYWVGYGLNFASIFVRSAGNSVIGGNNVDMAFYFGICFNDIMYNSYGMRGNIPENTSSDTKAIDKRWYFHQQYNSVTRLPTFLAGVGLVAKFGFDAYHCIAEKKPMEAASRHYLEYGLGLILQASSMYFKEIDPKLLQQETLWEKAYAWIKDKISSLAPTPVPEPIPLQRGIERYV